MMPLPFRRILAALGLLALALGSAWSQMPAANPGNGQKPNIIFILCDDLGFGDLGISGNPYIQTPNIDALARHSIICTKGYAAYPICMPSRISILTGKYADRTGARMCVINNPAKIDQPWIPKVLKTAGYTTCALGKWGLGDHFPTTMKPIGFDTWAITHPGGGEDRFNFFINRPNPPRESSNGRYVTDVLNDEAIKFIEQAKGQPFYLYLAEPAPHFPLEAPDADVALYKNNPAIANGAAIIYGMVHHLDTKIGELVAYLKQKGLSDNTIIVFTSDNGAELVPWKRLIAKRWNDDLAGGKGEVWEGGIKVPTFISWPARFGDHPKPYNKVVTGIDWQPTLLAAAGVTDQKMPIDGVNLLPAFLNQSAAPTPIRYWAYNKVRSVDFSNGAMRDGDWKLVRPPIHDFNVWAKPHARPDTPTVAGKPEHIHPGKNKFVMQDADLPEPANPPAYQLFNLAADPGEKHDLAAQQPERVATMSKAFEAWFKDITSGPDNANLNTTVQDPNAGPPE